MRAHGLAVLCAAALAILGAGGPAAEAAAMSGAADEAPPPPPGIAIGDTAPDFTLRDQDRNEISLHQFRGKKRVILAFYVFAFTGG